MELDLSNLVDLSLGKPHYLACENFNLLHTLLHIILKKMNLSNTRVMLTDDLAEKAQELMKMMPKEPSICYKEFTVKNDGSRVKKRNSREIYVKRSLTQVKQRWPKCCPMSESMHDCSSSGNASSSKSPRKSSSKLSEKPQKTTPKIDKSETVNELDSKLDTISTEMSIRINVLENKLNDVTSEMNAQLVQNCAALDEFMKLKNEFEELAPILEQLRESSQPFNIPNKINSENCEVKVNIRKKPTSSSNGSKTTASDEEDNQDEKSEANEIEWLKDRMIELSESLKLQSLCLQRLKCEDFSRLQNHSDNMSKDLDSIRVQLLLQQGNVKGTAPASSERAITESIEYMKTEMCELRQQLQNVENKINDGIKSNLINSKPLASGFSQAHKRVGSEIVQSTVSRFTEPYQINQLNQPTSTNALDKAGSRSCPNKVSELPKFMSKTQSISENIKSCPCPDASRCYYSMGQPIESLGTSGEATPTCTSDQPEGQQPDIIIVLGETLDNVAKQVSTHNFCLQQLIRDICNKLDRCEFEMCRRQVCEMIDVVMQLKQDRDCPPTAAGGTIPFLRNVNCISCHTTTNMSVTTNTVPRAPALKYGRVSCESSSSNVLSRCGYSLNGRRVGGSNTKISRKMQVCGMRYKRLKTPVKIVSSIYLCKNRFRRSRM